MSSLLRIARLAFVAAVVLAPTGCGGGASPSPSPSATPIPSPTGGSAYRLRATLSQALPPASTFAWLPVALVTDDLRLVLPGPMIAIYPGPLLPNVLQRPLTAAGWTTIGDEARRQGLLGERTDFTGGAMAPGSVTGHLQLVVDGVLHDLVGDPNRIVRCGAARCIPDPGTPEAFGAFWARFGDLPGWLGTALGPESAYEPTGWAVLVGPPPTDQSPLGGGPVDWPLATPLSAFGSPYPGDASRRCGLVTGADATTLGPALRTANELTRWRDATAPGVEYGLVVRPILPGDTELCGPGS